MKRNKYETLEDLLTDPSFRKWAKGEQGSPAAFWEDWVNRHPGKKALVEQASLILNGVSFAFKEQPVAPQMIREEWKKLSQRASGSDQSPATRTALAGKSNKRIGLWGWRAAASILILVVLGFLFQQYILNPVVSHQTPFGKQLSIVLPDSSRVELNANSSLTYRKWNPRKVWLDGEAFFQVKKVPATGANFLVITNDLTVEVLGTAFNVIEKKYKTEVILEEGSIKLKPQRVQEEEVYLEPGEMAIFSAKTSQKVEKRQVKPQSLTSWKDGVLEFEDAQLSQVMNRIEEIYGWRAVYHDEELQARNISTPLPSNDLESALIMLSKAIGIRIDKVEEDKVLLLY